MAGAASAAAIRPAVRGGVVTAAVVGLSVRGGGDNAEGGDESEKREFHGVAFLSWVMLDVREGTLV
jgi:hypothetical protein